MFCNLTGAAETTKALEGLKKSTVRGVLERVLKRAAKGVEASAQTNAPVLTGTLKKSIGTEIIRNNAGKRAYAAHGLWRLFSRSRARLAARLTERPLVRGLRP